MMNFWTSQPICGSTPMLPAGLNGVNEADVSVLPV